MATEAEVVKKVLNIAERELNLEECPCQIHGSDNT